MAVLVAILLPFLTTMVWEFFIREWALAYWRKAKYRLVRRFGKEPPIGQLRAKLATLCTADQSTLRVMQQEGLSSLSLDACFEILHSHLYKGWRPHEIEYQPLAKAPPLKDDLAAITRYHPPDPPNNGKYRLMTYSPDSTERPTLRIQLASTDYFSTYPIQRRLFEDVLEDPKGSQCSPFTKYGAHLLEFGDHPLPNIVCVHAIVVLPSGNLLLTQRVRSSDRIDWHAGKWSCSFEEQMTVKINDPRNDETFLDTAYAGCVEELGITNDHVDDVRILSLVLEAAWNVVVPIALINVHATFEDIRSFWELKARDGVSRELRNVTELTWSSEAIRPILKRERICVGEHTIGPDDWHGTARMRLLQSLFHRDGIEKTLRSVAT